MQAVKRWLGKLFAWWPWKRRPEPRYTQATRNINSANKQKTFWQTLSDGSEPWTGSTSVAIDHKDNKSIKQSPNVSSSRQHPDAFTQPPGEDGIQSPASPAPDVAGGGPESAFTPQEAQHLEYLRLLIRRGAVNEGFSESKMPEQYKRYGQKRFGAS
ncbi:MAG TPA: hypothetical protein VH593_05845 [Ktedonobacteraceae bacterium]